MKIGELAASAGYDVQTVRFYEREGMLEEPQREASGYRRYDERHRTRLNFIRHCRSLDIPLPEVRQLLEFAANPTRSCSQVKTFSTSTSRSSRYGFKPSRRCKSNWCRCASHATETHCNRAPSWIRS